MRQRHHVIAFPLLLILLFKACPSQNDITRMAKASRELAHDTVTIEKVVGEFYDAGRISKAKKDKFADDLKVVAVKGKAFNDILVDLDKKYPEGTLPPDTLQFVRDTFAPISALVGSLIADLTKDGMSDAGKSLESHTKTINEVIK